MPQLQRPWLYKLRARWLVLGRRLGLALGLGLMLAQAGNAATAREYDVELIVFERPDSAEPHGNVSPARIVERLRQMDSLAKRASSFAVAQRVTRLEVMRINLLEAGYRILTLVSWRQPARSYRHAPLLAFGRADSALPAAFARVYTTSLIYADLNLQLSRLLPPPGHPAAMEMDLDADQPHYFIDEKRRLKFKQVHYFDHPRFGALLGVWPAEEEFEP